MATTKNSSSDTIFDPTRYDYSLTYSDGSAVQPPTLSNIRSGGWYNYYGVSTADANAGRVPRITMQAVRDFSNLDYMLWLEGFYQNALVNLKKDTDAIREARKLMDENPVYARMLDLHKRGLL